MIIASILIYLVVLVLLIFPWSEGSIQDHELIWWPIWLIKLLIKTLWLILTTGWK